MKCTSSVCVYSLLYDVLVSLLSPNWEYNDRAWSKTNFAHQDQGGPDFVNTTSITRALPLQPNRPLCVFRAHPKMLHIAKRSLEGGWPTTALNGILLILKKIKRLPRDRTKRRWRTWLHWIGPYWSCTEESWSQRSKQKEHQNQSDHSEEQITVLWSPKWNIQGCMKLWQMYSLGEKMNQALP